jgi:4-diphosphocytidyl-2-C-methyl-D-erythritol kinase
MPGRPVAPLREAAPAKVNLFLHVTGRRADGYHLLDSLAVFADIADQVEARPAGDLALTIDGPEAPALLLADSADNLVLRAARALAAATGATGGARLRLHKVLPVASGIGGGSADAAATLRLLARAWRVDVPPHLAEHLALSLGADVPVCLGRRPARMGGIGEELLPVPELPAFGLVLANPGVAVSTPAVFRARDAAFSQPAQLPAGWPDAAAMAADLARLSNDLEAPARMLCPPVETTLAALSALPGCLLARMSGSGATCFALFATAAAARLAAETIERPPGWWVWGGGPYVPALATEIEAAA